MTVKFYAMLVSPVHCQWNNWAYGQCSASCGVGTRTNTRTKLVVETNGGTCTGQSTEIERCNMRPCPGKMLIIIYANKFYLNII